MTKSQTQKLKREIREIIRKMEIDFISQIGINYEFYVDEFFSLMLKEEK